MLKKQQHTNINYTFSKLYTKQWPGWQKTWYEEWSVPIFNS